MKNKRAFTLAEVLTTLMVIGIVAALTIPGLMNSYKKNTYVVKMKKTYSELNQGMKRIFIDKGCEYGDFECAKLIQTTQNSVAVSEFLSILSKYFKNSAVKTNYECSGKMNISSCLVKSDETAIIPVVTVSASSNILTMHIYVDVNGKKGPNEFGIDAYNFLIALESKNGVEKGTIIPYGSYLHAQYSDNSAVYWKNAVLCKIPSSYAGCTGRVFETGKIDF